MELIANPDIKRTVRATNFLGWENFLYARPYRPLQTVSLFNEGPSALNVSFNYPERPVVLLPNEGRVFRSEDVTGLSSGIKILYLKAYPGLNASVLVEGKFYD